MLTYLEYLNVQLNLSSRIVIALVVLFLFMQIIGELLEFKGKVVPEFLKVRKWFARKKQERETTKETAETIGEVKSLLLEVRKHYNADNIQMRDEWMRTVNEDLAENKRRWQDLSVKLDENNSTIVEELKGLIMEHGERIDHLTAKVETLHDHDEKALECDLSVMDDRICFLIRDCRRKGYTTADDRRRIGRMHEAYRSRGGNHGEENEYAIFCRLPTEEEYNRMNSENDK